MVAAQVVGLKVDDMTGIRPQGEIVRHEELHAAPRVDGAVVGVGAPLPDGGSAAAESKVGNDGRVGQDVVEEVETVGVDADVVLRRLVFPFHVSTHQLRREMIGEVVTQPQAAQGAILPEPSLVVVIEDVAADKGGYGKCPRPFPGLRGAGQRHHGQDHHADTAGNFFHPVSSLV